MTDCHLTSLIHRVDFELLSSSVDVESNPQMKAELEKLRKLTETVKESDPDNVSLLTSSEVDVHSVRGYSDRA